MKWVSPHNMYFDDVFCFFDIYIDCWQLAKPFEVLLPQTLALGPRPLALRKHAMSVARLRRQ
jgi:hypothetical protein